MIYTNISPLKNYFGEYGQRLFCKSVKVMIHGQVEFFILYFTASGQRTKYNSIRNQLQFEKSKLTPSTSMRTQRHPSVSLKISFPPSLNGVHADSNRTNFKADLDESFQSGIVKQYRFSIFTALYLILLRKKGIIHFRRVILFKEICLFFSLHSVENFLFPQYLCE